MNLVCFRIGCLPQRLVYKKITLQFSKCQRVAIFVLAVRGSVGTKGAAGRARKARTCAEHGAVYGRRYVDAHVDGCAHLAGPAKQQDRGGVTPLL